MVGEANPLRAFFYNLSLERFVPTDHPLRRIRPLIDERAIRHASRDLYASIGRPSIPPEQLLLALVGGYRLSIPSERRLVMERQCNMALRWFLGLNLDQDAWDASTFSQNRRRRFNESGLLERLFDDTVKRAIAAGLVSRHVSADGTLVRANASYKSFVPLEVALDPEEYKRRLRAQDREDGAGPQDPGNRAMNFRGERRSNATRRSGSDPASENQGCLALLDRARRRLRFTPPTLGADRGFFHEDFITFLLHRGIQPHIAVEPRGSAVAHARVRMRARGAGYQLSQRCRKLIEELFR
jgi:transposase